MLDWTDSRCRFFHRLISHHALLYTEMVTTGAIIYGNQQRHLAFNEAEHPIALQLGGSNPADLAACAKIAEDYGYDEVNLNVGCPSDRVQNGLFGACLMAEPVLVAKCVSAMQQVVNIPITVKSRIGIDDKDSYPELVNFIQIVADAGCQTFIIHARKAWLSGLSPKQNRDIPPLRYDIVRQIKQDFSHLEIILNGGLTHLEQAQAELSGVDGVMLGREAYHNPYILAEVDQRFYNDNHPIPSRLEIIEQLIPFIQQHLSQDGAKLSAISRHILGLFHQQPKARKWRRYISENACLANADERVLFEALATMQV